MSFTYVLYVCSYISLSKGHLGSRDEPSHLDRHCLLTHFWVFSKSQFCSLFQEERADCFAFIALCPASVNILWYFLAVPRVGLQCVIVVFPDRTHLLID